jgi:hypothetical protein
MRRNFLRTCRGRVPAIFACDTRKGKSYQYHLRKSHDVIEMRVSEEDRLGSDAVRANRIQERLGLSPVSMIHPGRRESDSIHSS